jgi:predicted ATPase
LCDHDDALRIAFSGTHRSGKSTLIEHVAELLPRYTTVLEPYHLLEEEGYEVAEEPSIDDFEAQLEKSIASLEENGDDVLFDRCPVDILAYLVTHEDADSFDVDDWLDRIVDSMKTLDLVVFVPIEAVDRIALPSYENREQRRAVHEKLEELLVDDALGVGVEVLRVEGAVRRRVEQVTAWVNTAAARKR